MKVGTDGVLLGCLCEAHGPQKALDIGTGSGLIALQLAQRFKECAIHGIEIEKDAADQAALNFAQAPWSDRLTLIHADVKDWPSHQPYDLIVCNPPFYPNSHPAKGESRRQAREQRDLSYVDLAQVFAARLSDSGSAWCILPADFENEWQNALYQSNLHISTIISISAVENRKANRLIVGCSKIPQQTVGRHLSIRKEDGAYTADYLTLTKAFYLFA